MNVDIDLGGIDLKKQTTNRIPAFHQSGVIPFHQSKIQGPIFYRTAIDEEMMFVPGRPGYAGLPNETPENKGRCNWLRRSGVCCAFCLALFSARYGGRKLQRQELLFAAVECSHPFAQRS